MAEAGKRGAKIRSDCWIQYTPGGSDIQIQLTSKVASLYGKKIEAQIRKDLTTMGLSNGRIKIEDTGALPYVISARLETAVLRSDIQIKESAIPQRTGEFESSSKNRLRRSRLYVPGNQPHLFIHAGLHQPDGIILDLEDSVSPAEKDAARVLVRNALLSIDFMGAERMLRINQLPMGLEDLEWIVSFGVQMVLIPKCENGDQVRTVEAKIKALKPAKPVWLMPIIESALGCFNALDIATASDQVAALSIGLEDYTADLGVQRTAEGRESLWARHTVINAAKAAGIQAIDSVYSDVSDMEGLRLSVIEAKSLGFEGKGCIHPNQIQVIHKAFAPSEIDIRKACEIVLAYEKAESEGLGVVALGSKMIDAPVVKRALTMIQRAEAVGLINNDWRKDFKGRS
ncbi:aldolase/citrate lyase family protein [bacterium]